MGAIAAKPGDSILGIIHNAGLEPDQRLLQALKQAPGLTSKPHDVSDAGLFLALYRLNCIATRHLAIDLEAVFKTDHYDDTIVRDPGDAVIITGHTGHDLAGPPFVRSLERAIEMARTRDDSTLSTGDIIRSILEQSIATGDDHRTRPVIVDYLTSWFHGSQLTPLSAVADAGRLLEELRHSIDGIEDFEYALTFHQGRLAFRVLSRLGDFVHQPTSNLLIPTHAVLLHFRDQFGGFTELEISELEALINSRTARESDLQRFFERHPHFLRLWDHREVFPHVTLTRPEGDLVPDFVLIDRELQRAAIVELKLPSPRLVRRQHNRDRFAAAISEARAQLLTYRDWFRDPFNRQALSQRVGMEIYEPQLLVIIGRSTDFESALDRQRLSASAADVRVVTYDDIRTFAERRRMIFTT